MWTRSTTETLTKIRMEPDACSGTRPKYKLVSTGLLTQDSRSGDSAGLLTRWTDLDPLMYLMQELYRTIDTA